MSRNLSLIAASALTCVFCLTARGQDTPSLGDLARQAQKDKATKRAAKVFTNDDMPSGSGEVASGSSGVASTPGSGAAKDVPSPAAGKPGAVASPAQTFDKVQSALDEVESLDRATLATFVLQDHNNVNFPGRAAWEQKLFAAKQTYVARGRDLLQKARQLETAAEAIKEVKDPDDPRVKSLTEQLQQIAEANQQNTAAFKAVAAEGQDLAAQASPH